jgi:hypothetical protein
MMTTVVAMWVLIMSAGTGSADPTHSQEFTAEDRCEAAKLHWLSKRHRGSEGYAFCTRK